MKDQKPAKMVKSFVISRKKWLRGNGEGELRRKSDGRQCCVGIFASACGIPKETLNSKGTLNDIGEFWADAGLPQELCSPSSSITDLYAINDEIAKEAFEFEKFESAGVSTDFSKFKARFERQREKRIRDGFKELGVRVRFTD